MKKKSILMPKIVFFLCLLSSSCSLFSGKQKISYSTVNLKSSSKTNDDISILENANKDEIDNQKLIKEKQKDQKITLLFGPGLYLTSSFLPIIRKIEKNQNRFLSVTGHGMGAYFATMFAFHFRSDYIEWKFYTFLEEIKGKNPYSKNWLQIFEKILLTDLKGKRIEDAKIKLILPYYDVKRKKVKWQESGDLVTSLLANMNIYPNTKREVAAFPWEFFNPYIFRNLGASKFVALLPYSKAPKFKNTNHYLMGVFSKGLSNFIKSEDLFEKSYAIPLDQYRIDMPLKTISELPRLIEFAKEIELELFTSPDDRSSSGEKIENK